MLAVGHLACAVPKTSASSIAVLLLQPKLHTAPSHLCSSAIQQPCRPSVLALSAQFFPLICNPRPDDRNGGVCAAPAETWLAALQEAIPPGSSDFCSKPRPGKGTWKASMDGDGWLEMDGPTQRGIGERLRPRSCHSSTNPKYNYPVVTPYRHGTGTANCSCVYSYIKGLHPPRLPFLPLSPFLLHPLARFQSPATFVVANKIKKIPKQ